MTKEEAAENYAHNHFDMHDERFNYQALKRGFLAGWEACERLKALEELTQMGEQMKVKEIQKKLRKKFEAHKYILENSYVYNWESDFFSVTVSGYS